MKSDNCCETGEMDKDLLRESSCDAGKDEGNVTTSEWRMITVKSECDADVDITHRCDDLSRSNNEDQQHKVTDQSNDVTVDGEQGEILSWRSVQVKLEHDTVTEAEFESPSHIPRNISDITQEPSVWNTSDISTECDVPDYSSPRLVTLQHNNQSDHSTFSSGRENEGIQTLSVDGYNERFQRCGELIIGEYCGLETGPQPVTLIQNCHTTENTSTGKNIPVSLDEESGADVNEHVKLRTEENPFEQRVCGGKCTEHDLAGHACMTTDSGEKPHKCGECHKSFCDIIELLQHVVSHTSGEVYSKTLTKQTNHDGKKKEIGGTSYMYTYQDSEEVSGASSFIKRSGAHMGQKQYQCQQCSKIFRFQSNLNRHLRIHTGVKSYKCQICSKAFSRTDDLARHVTTHGTEKPHKCNECDKSFGTRHQLVKHWRTHSRKRKCDEMFSEHNACNEGSGETAYLYCEGGVLNAKFGEARDVTQTRQKQYQCQQCGKIFRFQSNLNRHLKIHTGVKSYKCQICSKAFSRTDDLARHVTTHGTEKPHKCNECDKSFGTRHQLVQHLRTHSRKRKCDEMFSEHNARNESSGTAYLYREGGVLNVKFGEARDVTQTRQKQYQCQQCAKTFKHKSNFYRHKRIHTGVKSYNCQECGKAFSRTDDLARHLKTHGMAKPHKCQECDKSFFSRLQFLKHLKTHSRVKMSDEHNTHGKSSVTHTEETTNTFHEDDVIHVNAKPGSSKDLGTPAGQKQYQYRKCAKKLNHQSDFNKHKRIHTEVKSCKCQECDKVFSRADDLARHVRVHGVKKLHNCHKCGKSFYARFQLDKHLRTHSSKEIRDETGNEHNSHIEGLVTHTGESTDMYHRENILNAKSGSSKHLQTHTRQKKYQCQTCDKTFNHQSNLHRHKKIHTGVKSYKCEKCGKAFARTDDLARHVRIHAVEKPHKCHECFNSFYSSFQLLKHLRIHSSVKMVDGHDSCNKGSVVLTEESTNMFHTGDGELNVQSNSSKDLGTTTRQKEYQCEKCAKSFNQKSNLYRHLKIHTGIKSCKCQECGKAFFNTDDLARHVRIHGVEKPHKCHQCGKLFYARSHLNKHLRMHSNKKRNDELLSGCNTPEEGFSTCTEGANNNGKEVLNVMSSSTRNCGTQTHQKQYQCQQCAKTFRFQSNLNRHLRIHTGVKSYKCQICGKAFSRTDELKRHVTTHSWEKGSVTHPEETTDTHCKGNMVLNATSSSSKDLEMQTGQKQYQCQKCEKKFSHASDFNIHLRIHKGVKSCKCQECGKEFSRADDLARHVRIHGVEKLHNCHECRKSFFSRFQLVQHLRTHSSREEMCNEIGHEHNVHSEGSVIHAAENTDFHHKGNILNAQSSSAKDSGTQTTQKQYLCQICGKTFNHLSSMYAHMKMHTGVKSYKCQECDKAFCRTSDLARHVKIHGMEKPHKCHECGKSFYSRFQLVKHLRTHSSEEMFDELNARNEGSVTYTGETTNVHHEGDVFNAKSNLSKDLGTQTRQKEYQCEKCDKTFNQLSNLKRHLIIHTGVKSYRCEECGKAFSRKDDLARHMRIHGVEKPHKCQECDRLFYARTHLNKHMRIHSKKSNEILNGDNNPVEGLFIYTEDKDNGEEVLNVMSSSTRDCGSQTGRKQYRCQECAKTFNHPSNFYRHLRIHTSKRVMSFKCRTCGEEFSQRDEFKMHLKTHGVEKPQGCHNEHIKGSVTHTEEITDIHCNGKEVLNDKSGVTKDFGGKTGQKQYLCQICAKTFRFQSNLYRHLKIHTGVKSYKCEVCSKPFARTDDLARHVKIHGVEKPQICQ